MVVKQKINSSRRCAGCSIEFTPPPTRRRKSKAKYCNQACLMRHTWQQRNSPEKVKARFWSFVAIDSDPNKCWEWQGSISEGYGQVAARNLTGARINDRAHRVAFFLSTGIDPKGLVVCHACDNPPCCNPKHLFLGTQADNIHDAQEKGRFPKADYMTFYRVYPSLEIGQQIKSARRSKGLSLREVAEKVGMDFTTICRLESGDGSPYLEVFNSICQIIELDINESEIKPFTKTIKVHQCMPYPQVLKRFQEASK